MRKRRSDDENSNPQPSTSNDDTLNNQDENQEDFDLEETHVKKGSVYSVHGNIFHLKLDCLFLQNGVNDKRDIELTSELSEAEKFDDIVIKFNDRWSKNEITNEIQNQITFFQVKHKRIDSSLITPGELKSTNDGDFSMQKYFVSHYRIKNKEEFKKYNKKFVILTNRNFDDKAVEMFDLIDENPIDLLVDAEGVKFYKFKLDESSELRESIRSSSLVDLSQNLHDTSLPELRQNLLDSSPLDLLGNFLAERVIKSKKFLLSLGNKSQIGYYKALYDQEVIDIDEHKFHKNFLKKDGSHATRDLLHDIVDKNLRKKKSFLIDQFWEKLKKVKINFNSVDENAQIIVDESKTKEIKGLASALAKYLTGDLSKIEPYYDSLKKLKIIIESSENVYKFQKDFAQSANRHMELRKFLENELIDADYLTFEDLVGDRHINFKAAFEMELKNNKNNKDYKKDDLPGEKISGDDVDLFFKEVVFAVNYPNEVRLSKIIESKLGSDWSLLNAKLVSDSYLIKMLDWFKHKDGNWLKPKDGEKIFKNIKTLLNTQVSVGLGLVYPAKLRRKYRVTFKEDATENLLKEVREFLSKDMSILHIVRQNDYEKDILSTLKLEQVIEQLCDPENVDIPEIEKYLNQKDSYLFIDSKMLHHELEKKKIIHSFGSEGSHNLLIIDCQSKDVINRDDVVEKISEILKKKHFKKS